MSVKYYCVDCGQNWDFEELKKKETDILPEYVCSACGNDQFEIYEGK
jgi:DNA-directed RNA polymerase subunit RPC12/RpoP